MVRKLKPNIILIFDPYRDSETKLIKEILLEQGERVKILSPNETTTGDLLILPDTGGINTSTAAFYPHYICPPGGIEPQDQWMEFFRVNYLDWYVKKNIPIIGIGHSALMLYDHVHGGKIVKDKNNLFPIQEANPRCLHHNDFEWETSHLLGLEYIDDKFYHHVLRMIKPTGSKGTPVMELARPDEPVPSQQTKAFDDP